MCFASDFGFLDGLAAFDSFIERTHRAVAFVDANHKTINIMAALLVDGPNRGFAGEMLIGAGACFCPCCVFHNSILQIKQY